MYIRSLELCNFQKHENFKAEFTPRLNIIHGESDMGKSCIIRALSWLLFNSAIKGARKEGTARTSVRAVLDSGIILERIKSDKENAYIIEKDGDKKRYDAIGKKIPDEVRKIISVFPMEIDGEDVILNISPQLEVPFMLAESPIFRMKIFNKLTGNDLLDSVAQSFNKDILKLGREFKILDEELEIKQGNLGDVIHQIEGLSTISRDAERAFKGLKERLKRFLVIRDIESKLISFNQNITKLSEDIQSIRIPEIKNIDELRVRAEKLRVIQNLVNQLYSDEKEIEYFKGQLKKIKFPENVDSLKSRSERYEKVAQLVSTLRLREETYKNMGRDLGIITEEINTKTDEYKDILKKYGKCPTCHSEITSEVLEGIKL